MHRQNSGAKSSNYNPEVRFRLKKRFFIFFSIAIIVIMGLGIIIFGQNQSATGNGKESNPAPDVSVSIPKDSEAPVAENPDTSANPDASLPASSNSNVPVSGDPAPPSPPDAGTPAVKVPEEPPASTAGETNPDPYFADALFIGDSRTQGLMMHSHLTNATFYASQGISIKDLSTKPTVNDGGAKKTVYEALGNHSFGKVYIMLGANELGWPYVEKFSQKYAELVDRIKETQPNATIYVQSILPVSGTKSDKDKVYNNSNITKFNAAIEQMAKEKGVIYLKVNEGVADANGALPENAASDGIHLTKEYCLKWEEYLKAHKN